MKITSRRFLDTPTRSVHAATIEFWEDHPVFAWFGGSREGASDVCIYIHNLHNDGQNIVIGQKSNVARWNPILFSHDGKLWLFEKVGDFCDRWQTFVYNITNWKNNISEEDIQRNCQFLPAGVNGPVKTRPVVTGDEIICGSSVETFYDWTSYMETYEVINGRMEFKTRSKPLSVLDKVLFINSYTQLVRRTMGVIQPAIWKTTEGEVEEYHSFFRSSSCMGWIYYSKRDSETGEWTDPVATNLPNPNSGVDVATYCGRVFLVSNTDSVYRRPLKIQEIEKISDSEWNILDEVTIRDNIAYSDKPGLNRNSCISEELSYPYMIEKDGSLHLVYTYGRSRVEYVTILID